MPQPRRRARQQGWQRFIVSAKPAEGDLEGLIQLVLSESYQEASRDLKRHTEKASAARTRASPVTPGAKSSSRAATGEDSQLANLELQDALQKQQQAVQTLSNLSKSMHDTAKAIIHKIGG